MYMAKKKQKKKKKKKKRCPMYLASHGRRIPECFQLQEDSGIRVSLNGWRR